MAAKPARENPMNGLVDDIRLAARSLIQSLLISLLAVVTLALGIRANTAIFSVLSATLFSPLPYPHAERLVAVWGVMRNRDIDQWPASPAMVERYRRESELFDGFAAASNATHVFRSRPDAEPERIDAVAMTPNLFDVPGGRPMIGRGFFEADAAFNPNYRSGAERRSPWWPRRLARCRRCARLGSTRPSASGTSKRSPTRCRERIAPDRDQPKERRV
jgi:hypothetical protein